jgi:hypothetical protein
MSEISTITPTVTPTMGLVQFDHGGETARYYNNSASELPAGTPIVQGTLFGVPVRPIAAHSWGALLIEGAMMFPKAANDSSLTAGQPASGNAYIGKVEYGMGSDGTPGSIATDDTVVWITVEAAANPTATSALSGSITCTDIGCSDGALGITGLQAAQGGTVTATGGTSTTSGNAGGLVSMTGGTGGATGNGGAASIVGGTPGATSGTGGAVAVTGGGSAAGTNYTGGTAALTGGAGKGSGSGGATSVVGGAGGTTGSGGAIAITGGASAGGSGTAGSVTIDAGAATGGTAGTVTIGGTNASAVITGGLLKRSTNATPVAASGTLIGDAAALTATYDIQTISSAGATAGVILPTGVVKMNLLIVNTSATAAKLWPQSGGTINGGTASHACTVPANGIMLAICTAADTWFVAALTGATVV